MTKHIKGDAGKKDKKMNSNLFSHLIDLKEKQTPRIWIVIKNERQKREVQKYPFHFPFDLSFCLGMGSTAMAAPAQSQPEIIIKIAQTPCVTLKSAKDDDERRQRLGVFPLGWLSVVVVLASFLIFPSYALSFLLYLILIQISHFTIKLIGHAATGLHPGKDCDTNSE